MLPPFEVPRVRGGMKTRKMMIENALLHLGVVQFTLKTSHSYLRFVKLQLKLHPRYHNNFSSLHPIHQYGIQWRTSPSPDRLRSFGRQGRYRDWYANHPFPPYLTLLSPPANPAPYLNRSR